MRRRIKTFSDGSTLEYDSGRFDEWCVFFLSPKGDRFAPKDVEYFADISDLANGFGKPKTYQDFILIYEVVSKEISLETLQFITKVATSYHPNELRSDKLFSILYAGMVAEENKEGAILKKRIKRLGIHQLLLEDFSPIEAATFSLGKDWRTLDNECRKRGF